MRNSLLAGAGGVVAAFLGSLCCVGPLLFVTLGVGAGLASTFEPLRPLFGALMALLLGAGFWTVYGRRQLRPVANLGGRATLTRGPLDAPAGAGADHAGVSGAREATGRTVIAGASASCAAPRRRDVVLLWGATLLAAVLWTFPTWSLWLL